MSVDSHTAQPGTPDALIAQCLSGDQVAWEAIVRQHWRKVFNVAYKFVGRHDEAEDLTQDIFLKIFKALHTFDRRANFQTWIISISRNLCIDHYRSVRKERQTIAREVDTANLQPASKERGPYAFAEHQDLRELLRQALERCPRRCARPSSCATSRSCRTRRSPTGSRCPRDREVAHQPRPHRAGAAAQAARGQTAGHPPQARRARGRRDRRSGVT
jgi:RNA polymerase sigma factor (sigma-70 family)